MPTLATFSATDVTPSPHSDRVIPPSSHRFVTTKLHYGSSVHQLPNSRTQELKNRRTDEHFSHSSPDENLAEQALKCCGRGLDSELARFWIRTRTAFDPALQRPTIAHHA